MLIPEFQVSTYVHTKINAEEYEWILYFTKNPLRYSYIMGGM